MVQRSQFDYGITSLVMALSAQPWVPSRETIGGNRIAASGVPASYVVRTDDLLDVPLRVEEDEWSSLLDLIAFGQSGQTLTWYPDTDDPMTSFEVYLHSPAAGERLSVSRDGSYPPMFTCTLVLRGVSAAPWTPYFS